MGLNLSLQEVFVFIVMLLDSLSFSCPVHGSSAGSNFLC